MSKFIGDVSAYAYAVSKGYTGTEEEFAELMASYADVGQTAVDAKDAAVAAKTAAQTAATTATNKASEATTAATTATTKAGEASTSASTATSAKDTAVSASQTATTKASEATTAAATATSAKTDAVAANTAAQSAKTAAQTAQTGAETAAASVQSSAAQIQTNADDISELKEDLSDVKIDVNELNAQIFTLSPTLTTNGFIKSSDGTIDASSYAKCTDFLDVVSFTSLYWTCENGSSSVARVAFYNTAKDFIANLAITSGREGTVDLTQDIYANVRYVRVSYYSYPNKNFTNFKCNLYKNNSIVATTDQYKKTTGYGTPINALIFGDSITECSALTVANDQTTSYSFSGLNSYVDEHGDRIIYKMWPKLFEELVDCAEVRNYALSGASYKDQNDTANPRKSLSYQITLALNDLNNPNGAFTVDDFEPDVIILALGTNDQTPNDTPQTAEAKIIWVTDRIDIDATLANFDRSKFCEAVMWAYFTLRKHFPYALIICELPIQRMSNEIPLGTLHDYLKLLAQKYGGAVIADGAYDSGIVRENNVQNGLGATLKDGLHPNPKGQNMLARLIIAKYYSSFVPFKDMNP